ncbi:MAG: hypothetical protein WDN69_30400 [Aliidongia sp.]
MFRQLDAGVRDMVSIVRDWNTHAKAVVGVAGKLCWLLDSWDFIFEFWHQVQGEPIEIQREAVGRIVRVLPLIPAQRGRRAAGRAGAAPAAAAGQAAAGQCRLAARPDRSRSDGANRDGQGQGAGPMSSPPLSGLFDLEYPLEQISEAKFREIALLLEEARDQPEVQTIMERIRPRLQRVRPARKPNLQRLFYLPFEDLLVNEAAKTDDGRVTRRAAQRAWEFVQAKNDAAERRIYKVMETRLRGLEPGDARGQSVLARRMWPPASNLLDEASIAAATNKPVRQELVGDQTALIEEIRQLAAGCSRPARISCCSRRPCRRSRFAGSTSRRWRFIRQTVANSHDGKPDRAYAMLLTVMVRMSAPAEFLRRIMHLNLDLPMPVKQTVFARLGKTILADMEKQAKALGIQASDAYADRVDRAQRLVAELIAADQVLRDTDPTTKQQLAQLHEAAEEACAMLVNEASGRVRAALPGGGAASVEELVAVETALTALRKCQAFARQVELDRIVNQMLSTIIRELKIKSIRLFEARNAADPPDRAGLERDLYWCVRMLELAGDAEEADRVRLETIKPPR